MFERIKEFFAKHSLKFLSLLCGSLIWFGVASREETATEIELPVRVINLQDNAALVYPLPPTLPALLEGSAISLIHLKLNPSARFDIDLKNMPLGYSKLPIDRINFISPNIQNLKMLRIKQTSVLNIELDARIEQKIPVLSRIHVEAAPGFTLLGEPEIIPDSIYVSGARSAIAKIKYIPTQEISITNLKWSNSLPINLDLSSFKSIIDIADTSMFAKMQIEPLDHKIFSGIPVRLIGSFDRKAYSLSPSIADVEISGGKDLLSKIEPQNINLYIEFSRFSIENSDELSPTVHIPYPITNWQIHPDKFHLAEAPKNYNEN
jgi:YbbR domain-containing protein